MVTRGFPQGLAWLHARVGRRAPVTWVRRPGHSMPTNSRPKWESDAGWRAIIRQVQAQSRSRVA